MGSYKFGHSHKAQESTGCFQAEKRHIPESVRKPCGGLGRNAEGLDEGAAGRGSEDGKRLQMGEDADLTGLGN